MDPNNPFGLSYGDSSPPPSGNSPDYAQSPYINQSGQQGQQPTIMSSHADPNPGDDEAEDAEMARIRARFAAHTSRLEGMTRLPLNDAIIGRRRALRVDNDEDDDHGDNEEEGAQDIDALGLDRAPWDSMRSAAMIDYHPRATDGVHTVQDFKSSSSPFKRKREPRESPEMRRPLGAPRIGGASQGSAHLPPSSMPVPDGFTRTMMSGASASHQPSDLGIEPFGSDDLEPFGSPWRPTIGTNPFPHSHSPGRNHQFIRDDESDFGACEPPPNYTRVHSPPPDNPWANLVDRAPVSELPASNPGHPVDPSFLPPIYQQRGPRGNLPASTFRNPFLNPLLLPPVFSALGATLPDGSMIGPGGVVQPPPWMAVGNETMSMADRGGSDQSSGPQRSENAEGGTLGGDAAHILPNFALGAGEMSNFGQASGRASDENEPPRRSGFQDLSHLSRSGVRTQRPLQDSGRDEGEDHEDDSDADYASVDDFLGSRSQNSRQTSRRPRAASRGDLTRPAHRSQAMPAPRQPFGFEPRPFVRPTRAPVNFDDSDDEDGRTSSQLRRPSTVNPNDLHPSAFPGSLHHSESRQQRQPSFMQLTQAIQRRTSSGSSAGSQASLPRQSSIQRASHGVSRSGSLVGQANRGRVSRCKRNRQRPWRTFSHNQTITLTNLR